MPDADPETLIQLAEQIGTALTRADDLGLGLVGIRLDEALHALAAADGTGRAVVAPTTGIFTYG